MIGIGVLGEYMDAHTLKPKTPKYIIKSQKMNKAKSIIVYIFCFDYLRLI